MMRLAFVIATLAALPACLCRGSSQHIPLERWIPRARWGARDDNGCNFGNIMKPGNITIHHTAGPPAHDVEHGSELVRGIQDYHQYGNGWCDIGYHFLVDHVGNIYQGRPFAAPTAWPEDGAEVPLFIQGAHSGGANEDNIGISVMGNFGENTIMTRGDTPYEAVTLLAAEMALAFDISIDTVTLRGHRDWTYSTDCPGQIHDLLPELRQDIIARVAKMKQAIVS